MALCYGGGLILIEGVVYPFYGRNLDRWRVDACNEGNLDRGSGGPFLWEYS